MRRAGGELVDLRTGQERIGLQGARWLMKITSLSAFHPNARGLLQQAAAAWSPCQEHDRIGLRVR